MENVVHYIVLREGTKVVSQHHATIEEAVEEAKRLVMKEHDVFIVYKALRKVQASKPPVEVICFEGETA
jgi:uncharacterized protein YheU (UPF0270 family)